MQKHAALPDLAGVAAMVLAIFAGGWREKYPGFVRVGRGISHAHALRGIGFTLPEPAVALALGGNSLNGAENRLAKWA